MTDTEAENILNAFTNGFGSSEIRNGYLYIVVAVSDDYNLKKVSNLVPLIRHKGFGKKYDINVSTNIWYDPFCLRVPHVLFGISLILMSDIIPNEFYIDDCIRSYYNNTKNRVPCSQAMKLEAYNISAKLTANKMNYQSINTGMIAWCEISDQCSCYVNYQPKLIRELKALQNDLCEPLFTQKTKFKIINRHYMEGKSYAPTVHIIVS
jgi:hypothetical protein